MNKQIVTVPNCISVVRMLGTLALLFLEPLSLAFFIVYSLTGVTDVLDGTIARLTGTTSKFGAKLDSTADLMFYSVMGLKILPVLLEVLPWQLWVYVGIVVIIRLAAYTVGAVKYHQFVSLHTILNKLTGFGVFGIPYMIKQSFGLWYCWIACTVAFAASTWELILHCTRSKLPQ